MSWGAPVEIERRRRINIAVWAYAYEFKNDSLVSDQLFDETSKAIDLSMSTKNRKMDNWFKKNFSPHTGMWIHYYPNRARLEEIYELLKSKDEDYEELSI